MTLDENQEIDQEVEGLGQAEEAEIESTEAESSPDSGDNREDKSNGVQKRINELTAKRYEAERKAEEAERKLAELTANKPQEQASSSQIERPKLPDDIYDEDAMKRYHNDMAEYAEKVAEAKSESFYKTQQQKATEQGQRAESEKVLQKYIENAQRSGVDLEKLGNAEKLINQHNINPMLAEYLMKDNAGPQVITYLADNQADLYEVLSMSPIEASIKIATDIKAKALAKTPKVSNAPEPAPDIKGTGALEVDEWEKKYGKAEFL